MGERTGIAWTDSTWNPWQGCHKVSLGCRECYMFREKKAYGQDPNVVVRSKPHTFNMPLRLKTPPNRIGDPLKVFTCSWSDWFIEEADPWRDEAWDIIRRTPYLTYQIVTKRPERIAGRLPWGDGEPWPNVWGVVSAENQATADERVPILLVANFAVRGVSYEPALEFVQFDKQPGEYVRCPACGYTKRDIAELMDHALCKGPGPGLDWIIMGVESSHANKVGHVPDDYAGIARRVHATCRAAGIAFFQKQMPINGRVSHDPMEWAPEDRVREFPS